MSEKIVEPYDLLEQVKDKETFILFVQALADERKRAREIELASPSNYIIDGALDWANVDISTFLSAAIEYFQFHEVEKEPSWQMFAKFLYFGKIYE